MNALISEFRPNPEGSDPLTQTVELFGAAGENFSGWLLSIESDAGSTAGTVDRAFEVTGTFDSSGILTVEVPDLENPSFTYVLVDSFTGSIGDDFDLDNDGVADLDLASVGITKVYDAIGIPDAPDDEAFLYGTQLGGVDFNFTGAEPTLVFRSGSDGDFFAINPGISTDAFATSGASVSLTQFTTDPAAGSSFGAINPAQIIPESAFTLELLHMADQEASTGAISDAPNLSAVVNALKAQDLGSDGIVDNTLFLSSGDAFIPGVFFGASEALYGAEGVADIQIQNELGVQAIALGNHEFDRGTSVLAGLIDGSAGDGSTILGVDFPGAAFPYLSTNLDFSTDSNLAPLEVAGGAAPEANTVTSSVVIDVNGENVGVVGATTPTLASISSPGNLAISPTPFDATPTPVQLDAFAAEIQTEVDALKAADPSLNKIVLLAHMQNISIERALAERLTDVDIIVAGGSNTRLFDDNDRVRDGDSDQGQYPQFITNAGGTQTALVNTDGSYKYVGRLVIDFDKDGNIIPASYDAVVSGAYATDDQGVALLGAQGLIDPEIQQIVDEIEAQIIAAESNVFGVSSVFLNGNRSGTGLAEDPDGVRTQETNLGNLTADANLAIAQETDPEVLVSIKNGGGIRASIGETVVLPGGTEATRLPNGELIDGDGNVIKPAGGISQNDIQTTLAFNNALSLLTLTKQELVEVLEHGISGLPEVAGRFPQISGVKFSFDPDLAAGQRIQTAAIFDREGNLVMELVENGNIVGDSSETIRVVTLNFLAGGGDGYPFPQGAEANRLDLNDLDGDGTDDARLTGDARFASDGTEQDALAEFLNDNFADAETAFDQADTGPDTDLRIQNLNFTQDTVLDGTREPAPVATGDVAFETVAIFEGEGGEGASESVAHENGRLFVTNGQKDRIDIFTIPDSAEAAAVPVETIDLAGLEGYDAVQSVAVNNGVVAVAISRAPVETAVFGTAVLQSQPGMVAFFGSGTGALLSTVDVGNLPDQLTFNADGTQVLVAGEGEKNDDSDHDDNPLGTVAVIDVTDPTAPDAKVLDFTRFNGLEGLAREAGIRIQDGVSFAEDVEPEYIAISPDGTTAFVSLQENNAIAKIDLLSDTVVDVFSLGTVDFSAESALDANR